MERVLLLVDDEENILRSLKRLLRQEGYTILTASSGQEGLELLKENKIGVIISDQRMPNMSGTEFLSKVKEKYPDNVRIVLSGYTDLNSVTDAINQGAIYKFLTKPWEDELLRKNVNDAFEHYELSNENQRLTTELKQANEKLASTNLDLEQDIQLKSHDAEINLHALKITHDIVESFPLGVLGIGNDGLIAIANHKAHELLQSECGTFVGMIASETLPTEFIECYREYSENGISQATRIGLKNEVIEVTIHPLQQGSNIRGSIMVLNPMRRNAS